MFHVKQFGMFNGIIKIFPAAALILLLTACVGEEPDNIAYVTAVGIDKKGNEFLYTIQMANPTKISGGASEEGGSGGNIVENIAVEASTVYSALSAADSIVSKNLSLSHAKIFVFSEETAAEGLGNMNDVFKRNNDIRPDIIYAVAENAGEYLEEVKPMIELNPIKYYQLTYDNSNGSSVPRNNAADFFSNCISGDSDTLLPLAGIAEAEGEGSETEGAGSTGSSGGGSSGNEEESQKNKSQDKAAVNGDDFENRTKNYFAGEAGEVIKNKSEALGSAVFDGERYIGKIGSIETEIYNILSGKFKKNNITFSAEISPTRPITIRAEERSLPKYEIDTENKKARIDVSLECELLSLPTGYSENITEDETKIIAAEAVTDFAEKFAAKMYGEMGTDILGICGKAKGKFLTQSDYERFKDSFNPQNWTIEVHTNLKLRRMGMTVY